ncbi:hypothetical protein, partial [Escherichia coli]
LEAIGRGQDLDKLERCINAWSALKALEGDDDLNLANLKLRIANAIGLDTAGMLLTQEQKNALMAQQGAQIATQQGAAALGQGMAAQATASPEAMAAAADSVGMQPGM